MILFKRAHKLSQFITQLKEQEKTIGFVPTMGALHQGHMSLLAAAKEKADVVVCSIFVNPTQFNNPDDFERYPNTVELDIKRLVMDECKVLFLPTTAEIYPASYKAPQYDLGELDNRLEGKYRPGHFQGVCQVVDRLLQIVDPDFLFLGQKDYQQCQVIQRLLSLTGRKDVKLFVCPTLRETDGLAMSSRNMRLNAEQRAKAPALFGAMNWAKKELPNKEPEVIKSRAIQDLTERGFTVDYFEIADAATLLPTESHSRPAVVLVAAYLDDIRLIDNLPLS